ncbi:MAG: hypothetical protein IT252_02705 [Chitinophagaceae bacterium]|nr:hypothetical protein [Chitinophagaceae bacterium]
MAFISTAFCSIKNLPRKLNAFLAEHYLRHYYDMRLDETAANIAYFLEPMRQDLKVVLEFPYLDKVYRDSYYTYFSTKHKDYPKDCIRLIFFEPAVTESDYGNQIAEGKLQDAFLGYCVVRPLKEKAIGRNLLSRRALRVQGFECCQHTETALVGGLKLTITGFSHSSQDGETISCAETTIWAMMEYFSHKYPEYRPTLPSHILAQLNPFHHSRMLPSNGLTIEQISFALKQFGFGTLTYSEEADGDQFKNLLHVYVESGIPLVSVIEDPKLHSGHAQIIIGRSEPNWEKLARVVKRAKKMVDFAEGIECLVFQDDNLPPYQLMQWDKPTAAYAKTDGFGGFKLSGFVVPLYRKVYLEAAKAQKFFQEAFHEIGDKKMANELIFRMYLASSRSFKAHVAAQSQMPVELRDTILAVSMPKFVWCAEFFDKDGVLNQEPCTLMLLDATEYSDYWKDSFIFAAHSSGAQIKIENPELIKLYDTTVLVTTQGLKGFKAYSSNLI